MVAKLVPSEPAYTNDAEKKVTQALVLTLPDDVTVLHGVRVTQWHKDREGDLVILWPNRGIAVVEIKGGRVTAAEDGKFNQTNHYGQTKLIDPIGQAHEALYAIRDYVLKHSSIGHWFKTVHMAAFPYSRVDRDYQHPMAGRSQFIDSSQLSAAADQVQEALDNAIGTSLPTTEDCAHIEAALQAKMPDFHNPATIVDYIDERDEWIRFGTRENEKLLEFASAMPRFEVRGPAGSGKTSLAIAQAHGLIGQGKRVLYVCYTKALAAMVKHQEELLEKSGRISVVTCTENLARSWGIQIPEERDNDYWNERLPVLLGTKVAQADVTEKFDAIVVDESQDLSSHWWQAITGLLKEPDTGDLFIFGDPGQNIFEQDETAGLHLPQLRLTSNLRNTKQIAELASHLTDYPVRSYGLEGPDVLWLCVENIEEVRDAADEVVDMILDKYPEDQITLLMTRSRHGIHKGKEERDPEGYLRSIWDKEQVFYSTVTKFKGLERRCVVLAVDGFHDDQDPREILYVGVTRAIDVLCLVATREVLAQYFPDEALAKLENNPYNPVLPDEDDTSPVD
jgi:hypothetical protein